MAAVDYVTLDALKNTLSLEGVTFADDDIALAITAASRAIDEACYRRFYPGDPNEIRYYTPRGMTLEIDDLTVLDDLSTGTGNDVFATTLTENTQFALEPLNAAPNGKPWERIVFLPGTIPPVGRVRSVQVTGTFGWPETPSQIIQAAGILATKLLRRAREAPFGIVAVGIETATALRITRTDPDVAGLIDPFIRETVLA